MREGNRRFEDASGFDNGATILATLACIEAGLKTVAADVVTVVTAATAAVRQALQQQQSDRRSGGSS